MIRIGYIYLYLKKFRSSAVTSIANINITSPPKKKKVLPTVMEIKLTDLYSVCKPNWKFFLLVFSNY